MPRKILHLIAATVPGTGVDTFVLQLCGAQRRLGLQPTICCEAEGREPLFAAARAQGVDVAPLPAREDGWLPRKVATARHLPRQVGFVRGALRGADGHQLLHLHVVGGEGLTAYLGALATRAPLVVTHHTTLEFLGARRHAPRTRVTLALERVRADRMIFPYHRAQAEYLQEGVPEGRTEVIPFCADEAQFTGAAAPPRPGQPFRLLVASRLVPGKGHDLLVEALARLGGRSGAVELLLAGDGPTRAELEAQVARAGLGQVVRFLGHQPHAALPGLLREAHAIVLPTHMPGETFPVSLLEAACLGLPAIATRWFGIPDIVADGETGLLVEPKDVQGLATAVERLASDRTLWDRLSAGARERAEARFTSARVAGAYHRVYQAVS